MIKISAAQIRVKHGVLYLMNNKIYRNKENNEYALKRNEII